MQNALVWLTPEHIWLLVGLLGQGLFASRFIVQWFKSEMEGRSVIPLSFWYCSVGGGVVLLAYAIFKRDPVFIIGQGSGLFVYARNLWLIFKEREALRAAAGNAS
ncbi:MAG: lipid-A-disaccharide synthase N-terminal domain-containing protein [Rhizomicrobium sp.]